MRTCDGNRKTHVASIVAMKIPQLSKTNNFKLLLHRKERKIIESRKGRNKGKYKGNQNVLKCMQLMKNKQLKDDHEGTKCKMI